MRMEELSNSQYIKSTDTVERYLLGLVEQYFKNSNVAATTSREYIINKAVERMKDELSLESVGVMSITLPDGEVRTGAVSISLEDLGGEPAISPKGSAFNVSFGTERNTACEGDDPRLSDKRIPVTHTHTMSDIIGLEGALSTLSGKLDRVNDLMHSHQNKSILDMITYSGTQNTLDLNILETFNQSLDNIANAVYNSISQYKTETDAKISDVNAEIRNIENSISQLSQDISQMNTDTLMESKNYTDDAITKAKQDIDNECNGLATKDSINPILSLASEAYTLVGSMTFKIADLLDPTLRAFKQFNMMNVSTEIMDELDNRLQSLKDCQIEAILEYVDPTTGILVKGAMPYVSFESSTIRGSLQLSTNIDVGKLVLTFTSSTGNMPSEIAEARLIYNVYSVQLVNL